MQKSTLRIIGNKVILNIRERMCETPEELMTSDKFKMVLSHGIDHLKSKNSPLIGIFGEREINKESINDLIKTLIHLVKYENSVVPHIFDKSLPFPEGS